MQGFLGDTYQSFVRLMYYFVVKLNYALVFLIQISETEFVIYAINNWNKC